MDKQSALRSMETSHKTLSILRCKVVIVGEWVVSFCNPTDIVINILNDLLAGQVIHVWGRALLHLFFKLVG
jgi:hypothetical protein